MRFLDRFLNPAPQERSKATLSAEDEALLADSTAFVERMREEDRVEERERRERFVEEKLGSLKKKEDETLAA